MRLLHTSDWHLGRTFKSVGMLGVQERALDHLIDVVRAERVEAVLVSGDVYDRAVPGPEAVALLSTTLERLVDAGAQVVLSSGNHDSAIRLGFASGLLRRSGVHLSTSVAGVGHAVHLGEVAIYPIPYLEPAVCADALGAQRRTHAAVMAAAMDRVRAAHRGGPAVVMAHSVVTGAQTCDSERDISVGGVSAVPADTFAGMSYAALGHLHGAQRVGESAAYSGSPYAMSFGEATHIKSWTLVDLDASGAARTEWVPVPVERPLARLRGRLADLLSDPRHTAAEGAWCSVVLTDPQRPVGAMDRVRARFPHAIELGFAPEGQATERRSYASRVAGREAVDICCDFLAHVRGGLAAGPVERAELRRALEESRLGAAERDGEGLAAPGVASAGGSTGAVA